MKLTTMLYGTDVDQDESLFAKDWPTWNLGTGKNLFLVLALIDN